MNSQFTSVSKVAERLGVHRLTVVNLIKAGLLKAQKTQGSKGKYMIDVNSVEVYLAKMSLETMKGAGK